MGNFHLKPLDSLVDIIYQLFVLVMPILLGACVGHSSKLPKYLGIYIFLVEAFIPYFISSHYL